MVKGLQLPHAPERSCVVCRRRGAKGELLRVVRSGNELKLDREHRMQGRGCYIHPTVECVSKAAVPALWVRALHLGSREGEKATAKGKSGYSDFSDLVVALVRTLTAHLAGARGLERSAPEERGRESGMEGFETPRSDRRVTGGSAGLKMSPLGVAPGKRKTRFRL